VSTYPPGKSTIEGVAAPLPIASCDTDQIMPKQFLKIINKEGLSRGMLYDMRFDENGTPKQDFILNQEPWNKAKILVTAPNFGCGSSREHAVWGLMQWGIEAIIGHSFGEIFFSNAFNNGLLLAKVSEEEAHAFNTV
jgi:3-isopropylmalate/(R)-2-methylmalate dehydratase small subunit